MDLLPQGLVQDGLYTLSQACVSATWKSGFEVHRIAKQGDQDLSQSTFQDLRKYYRTQWSLQVQKALLSTFFRNIVVSHSLSDPSLSPYQQAFTTVRNGVLVEIPLSYIDYLKVKRQMGVVQDCYLKTLPSNLMKSSLSWFHIFPYTFFKENSKKYNEMYGFGFNNSTLSIFSNASALGLTGLGVVPAQNMHVHSIRSGVHYSSAMKQMLILARSRGVAPVFYRAYCNFYLQKFVPSSLAMCFYDSKSSMKD